MACDFVFYVIDVKRMCNARQLSFKPRTKTVKINVNPNTSLGDLRFACKYKTKRVKCLQVSYDFTVGLRNI